jgi:hypothetical protein
MRWFYASSKFLLLAMTVVLCSGPLYNCECGGEHFLPPQLEVDQTVLQFNDVAVGYPQERILRIGNLGKTGLSLDKVDVRLGAASPFSVLGIIDPYTQEIVAVPGSVGPGMYVDLVVQYDPQSETADDFDTLEIMTNDPDDCPSEKNQCEVQLNGTGAPPNAELEVVCQSEELCPPPDGSAVCRVILDGMNIHPIRVAFNFCEVAEGKSRSLKALLKNIGNIPMSMDGFEFDPAVGDPADFRLLEPQATDIEIEPGGDQMLTLIYLPSSEGVDNTGMDVQTSDDDLPSGVFSIRLLAFCAEPDIQVTPENIPFTGVTQGSSDTKPITVHNRGNATLVIHAIEVSGGTQPGEFTVDKSELTLLGNSQDTVNVTYSPQDGGQDDGSVTFSSNDPDSGIVVVTLGAEVRPDLEVVPDALVEFVDVLPGETAPPKDVTVRNIGYADLTIDKIEFPPDKNPGDPPVFGLDFGDPPPSFPLVLAPAESFTFKVTFTDNTMIEDEMGQLEIFHNSPNDSLPYILFAASTGTPANLPPVAIIDPTSLTVHGLNPITLDGTKSFDPDEPTGDYVDQYNWSFLFKPTDLQGNPSQATLDSTDQPTTSFTPDITGIYIVRLVVFDSFGVASTPTDAEISVNP